MVVADPEIFHTQDSHKRVICGIWFFVGAVFGVGGFAIGTFRPSLIVLSVMVAIAGLFRLSGMGSGVIFSAAIVPSIALELIGFPLLARWLVKSKNGRVNAEV